MYCVVIPSKFETFPIGGGLRKLQKQPSLQVTVSQNLHNLHVLPKFVGVVNKYRRRRYSKT